MITDSISALVLAAGKGTRMKSAKAKVLHDVFFVPMIHHVLDALAPLPLAETIVVTGHQSQEVRDSLESYDLLFAYQEEQLGTGHAVLAARELLVNLQSGAVLILCGDTPLIRTETLQEMLVQHFNQSARLTVMTTILDDPTNYGRIITDQQGNILRIVEEKDASVVQKKIQEINAGIYCVNIDFLYDALNRVGTDNQQGEIYLTDIIEIAEKSGLRVNKFICHDSDELLGVNSRGDLAVANKRLQERRNRQLIG